MDKKYIAISIFAVCIVSLFIGILSPKNKAEQIPTQNNLFVNNIETTGDKIALLNIEGVISSNTTMNSWTGGEFTAEACLASIEKIMKDDKVKAVIIRINSPGGTVAASQDVYDAILRLRKKKPVVVSMADVAASGGYYIASAADRIVAQKGTMTGSIGVIFNFVDVAGLADKVGINSNVIKSGKFKDSGSMYRKMSADEQKLFQTSVDTAYGQFVGAIIDARVNRTDSYKPEMKKLATQTLKTYADGRVFLGEEAYKLGFVDKIGSLYDAKIVANEMTGMNKTLPLVPYNKMSGLKSIFFGMENKIFSPIKESLPFSYTHSSQPLMILE